MSIAPPKILTVDDSRLVRTQIKQAFKDYDVQFIEAENGEEGLAALEEKPDLVFLDITMPVMAGDEMLIRLREIDEYKGLPVVMVSAECTRENILRMAQLGSNNFIKKPFKKDELILKAHDFLEERLLLKEDKEQLVPKKAQPKSFFTFSYKYLVITIPDNRDDVLKPITMLYQSRINEAKKNKLSNIFIDTSTIDQASKSLVESIIKIKNYADQEEMSAYVMCHQTVQDAITTKEGTNATSWQFFPPSSVEIE